METEYTVQELIEALKELPPRRTRLHRFKYAYYGRWVLAQ